MRLLVSVIEPVTLVDNICLSDAMGVPQIKNDDYVLFFILRAERETIVYFERFGTNTCNEGRDKKFTLFFV